MKVVVSQLVTAVGKAVREEEKERQRALQAAKKKDTRQVQAVLCWVVGQVTKASQAQEAKVAQAA